MIEARCRIRDWESHFPHRLAALVGLYDDVDSLDPVKMLNVATLVPVGGARQAKGRDAMMPKGVNVALALDQNNSASLARLLDSVEAVEADLGAAFPTEPVVASLSKPEPDREDLAQWAEIGHANRRIAFVGAVGETAAA